MCCCKCYTNWLLKEAEFSKAAQEYSSSVSQEQAPPKPTSDDEEVPTIVDGKSMSSQTTKALKSINDLPPDLALHIRHSTSIYSTKSIVRPLSASKSKGKMRRQKSGASNKSVPAVAYSRQLSMTTHAQLSMCVVLC